MKPSAILMSDGHIRESQPECRQDDFMETQARKWAFVGDLQKKYNVPILLSGDLFHHWKPSPWLLGWAFDHLPDDIVAIPGQHDLKNHNIDYIEDAGIYVLAAAGKITLLLGGEDEQYDRDSIMYQAFPWGVKLQDTDRGFGEIAAVALLHMLVYKGKPPFPGAENCGGTGKQIIKQMPGFDLILCGDNHQTFVETSGDTVLVNPGSFTRQTAAQVDHKPSVFLWDAKTNEIEQVFIPIDPDAVSREHIEVKEERDERIEAFIESLNKDVELGISFEENMTVYLANNDVTQGVKKLIGRAME